MIAFGIFLLLCIFAPVLAVVFAVIGIIYVVLVGITK